MFEELFKTEESIKRYREAPLLESRLRYLAHCAANGTTHGGLKQIAHGQLVIISSLNLHQDGEISRKQIERAAERWVSRKPRHHAAKDSAATRVRFVSQATHWLQFLDRLSPTVIPRHPHGAVVDEYAAFMAQEKGLSPLTIHTSGGRVDEFLDRFCKGDRNLHDITIMDIDHAITQKGTQDGCSRASIQTYAYILRAFFRYAEGQRWCTPGLAAAIVPPRVYRNEMLPAGPAWDDVQRLCGNAEGDRPSDIRDRAILLLFSVYALRTSEVRRLRLEDLDWEKELIHVRRTKQQQRTQTYPLTQPVGNAIIRYLREVRPRCRYREVFLSLKAPLAPIGNSALWQIVSRRLRPLVTGIKHHGPHSLRHACATRLLGEGLSMKEIGDHLGHSNLAATSVYAKVDIAGLRKVADFNLEGLI